MSGFHRCLPAVAIDAEPAIPGEILAESKCHQAAAAKTPGLNSEFRV